MSDRLDFSSTLYKDEAQADCNSEKKYNNYKTPADAFLLVIKDVSYENLDNYCIMMQKHFNSINNTINLSIEDCYKISQGISVSPILIDEDIKNELLQIAYKCIEQYKYLGSNIILDGKINTSSWISHSLYEGKFAGELATVLGYDASIATKLGILHDIGRKLTHTFNHTILGYEMLKSNGWDNEATCCLTHSFIGDIADTKEIKGNRCCNCDPACKGFYVDDNGNPCWINDNYKDDITMFLEQYNYNIYDIILNASDLMCTDKGVLSPYNRVQDISTRKIPDPVNRNYFKAQFINLMIFILYQINPTLIGENVEKVKASKNILDSDIDKTFFNISFEFYREVQEKIQLFNSKNEEIKKM